MTDVDMRNLLDDAYSMLRYAHEVQREAPHNHEAIMALVILYTATTALLELAEANHHDILTEADWPTVRNFFTVQKGKV